MSNFKIGLQLYGVRDEIEKDMDATLKAVSEMGYECVEFAGYFGKSSEEIRAILDKYNLDAVSVHQSSDDFLNSNQSAVDFIKALGVRYCVSPWYDREKLVGNEFPKTVEKFKKVGKFLKDNGIQFLYHNHDFEFTKENGEYILDRIYDSVPRDLLKPEIDTCWVHYSGIEPTSYMKKFAGDIDCLHLKDFVCKKFAGGPVYALIGKDDNDNKVRSHEDTGFEFRPVGQGIQDIPAIVKAAAECGTKYLIVEQDLWYDTPSLEVSKQSINYLKSIL